MNNVHQVVPSVKTHHLTANDLYWRGFTAYCNSNCVAADLATKEERRGWWAALDAQAECTAEYEDSMEEEAFMRSWH
jgi:hypothetical protein